MSAINHAKCCKTDLIFTTAINFLYTNCYRIMKNCWNYNSKDRPNFKTLGTELKMAFEDDMMYQNFVFRMNEHFKDLKKNFFSAWWILSLLAFSQKNIYDGLDFSIECNNIHLLESYFVCYSIVNFHHLNCFKMATRTRNT